MRRLPSRSAESSDTSGASMCERRRIPHFCGHAAAMKRRKEKGGKSKSARFRAPSTLFFLFVFLSSTGRGPPNGPDLRMCSRGNEDLFEVGSGVEFINWPRVPVPAPFSILEGRPFVSCLFFVPSVTSLFAHQPFAARFNR